MIEDNRNYENSKLINDEKYENSLDKFYSFNENKNTITQSEINDYLKQELYNRTKSVKKANSNWKDPFNIIIFFFCGTLGLAVIFFIISVAIDANPDSSFLNYQLHAKSLILEAISKIIFFIWGIPILAVISIEVGEDIIDKTRIKSVGILIGVLIFTVITVGLIFGIIENVEQIQEGIRMLEIWDSIARR